MNVINFPTPTFSYLSAGRDGSYVLFSFGDTPSLALQHGVPPETIRHAVTRGTSEEPASILGAVADSIAKKSFLAGV